MAKALTAEDELFELRLARSGPDLFPMLEALYGVRPDYPAFRDKLVEHKQYIATHGEDMPEIRNWRWGL